MMKAFKALVTQLVLGLAVAFAVALPTQVPESHSLEARTHKDSKWTSYNVGDPGRAGACGFLIHKSAFGIALSPEKFQPNLCGRIISLTYGGKQAFSQVLDRCDNCGYADLNITERLFKYFADDVTTPIVGDWEWGSS